MEDRFTLPVVQIAELPLYDVAAHGRILHIKNFPIQNKPSYFTLFLNQTPLFYYIFSFRSILCTVNPYETLTVLKGRGDSLALLFPKWYNNLTLSVR